MIRVIVYLIAIALMAIVAAWFADRPGEVTINWQGQRLETSVSVLAIAAVLMAALAIAAWWLLQALLRAPAQLAQHRRNLRARRGYLALSQGLIAVGSGDARAARAYADEARRIAPSEPLTLLLGAQAAQLSGDRSAAESSFQTMVQRADTKLLGLHGLFIEAQRRKDPAAARLVAEEAAREAAAPAWAGRAVLDFRCATGDWAGALDRLERNMQDGLIDPASYQRQRAVLLTARAGASEASDRRKALTLALEAVKLAPDLVPAAALAGRLLGEAGEMRRAARVIETAWQASPHSELAEAYAHLRPGDSARDRLRRIEALAKRSPGAPESAFAVAEAALDAREFAIARAALTPLMAAPTQRAALLFARLAEMEGDEGRAREWTARALRARRDPAWTADGLVSDRWMPVSPVSGKLDAFQWREPVAALPGQVIESGDASAAEAPPAAAPAVPERAAPQPLAPPPINAPEPLPLETTAPSSPAISGFGTAIPLGHAPDDPGPGGEPPPEPAPKGPPLSSNGWDRLRALFK
jgi:HemY protein